MAILSTKLLRPILFEADLIHCTVCSCPRLKPSYAETWYEDFSQPAEARAYYCPEHALLEDLDPDYSGNQSTLFGIPVSRKMPLQMQSLDEIFERPVVYKTAQHSLTSRANGLRPPLWVSLPVGRNFFPHQYVEPKSSLVPVFDTMINGLHGDYYVDVAFRRDGFALVSLKYQQILGCRFVCVIPNQAVLDFFPQMPVD